MLCGALLLSVCLLGAVHWSVVICLAALIWSAGALHLVQRRTHKNFKTHGHISVLTPASLAFSLLGLGALLQLIPLSLGVQQALGMPQADLYLNSWSLVLNQAPTAPRPTSLDPAATADRALRWLTLACALFVSAQLLGRPGYGRIIKLVMLGIGAVAFGLGLVDHLIGQPEFLGLYKAQVPSRGLSPFVNPNHSAAFYGLCSIAALSGLLKQDNERVASWMRLVWGLGAVGFGLLSVVHDSRSVWIALTISLSIIMVGFVFQSSRSRDLLERLAQPSARKRSLLVGGIIVSGLGGLVALLASGALIPLASADALARAQVIRAAFNTSSKLWLFGAGAGAVEQVIYPTIDWHQLASATIPVAENELAEWAVTMGWPLALLATLGLISYLRHALPLIDQGQRRLRTTRQSALALWIYLALVAMFHFPFMALGVGLPALVLLEGSIARAARPSSAKSSSSTAAEPSRQGFKLSWRGQLIWHSVLGLLLVLAIALGVHHKMPELKRRDGQPLEPSQIQAHLIARPADSSIFSALATDALANKAPEDALKYAKRAFELQPQAHRQLLVAHCLASAGQQAEATTSYGQLFDGTFKSLNEDWVMFLLNDVPAPEARALALKHANERLWRLAARHILAKQGQAQTLEFLSALVEQAPTQEAAYDLLIRQYIGARLYDLAELWARMMSEAKLSGGARAQARGHVLLVHTLMAQDRADDALAALEEALARFPKDDALLLMRLKTLKAKPSADDITRIERAHSALCATTTDRDAALACDRAKAWLYVQRGEETRADQALVALLYDHAFASDLIREYLKRRKCLKLKSLATQYGASRVKGKALDAAQRRAQAQLEQASKRCAKSP